MLKRVFLLLLSVNCSVELFSQDGGSREVIVTKDTTYECNDMRKESTVVETFIKNGLKFFVFDSPFGIGYIEEKKDNIPNGLYIAFYLKSNMPKEKGMYIDGNEDGEWFYWNEKGVLTMKKLWKKGKVIKTIKYK